MQSPVLWIYWRLVTSEGWIISRELRIRFLKGICITSSNTQEFSCSTSLYTLAVVAHSGRTFVYTVESHCDFNFISLMANETKHISCLLAIWLSSFVMYLFESLKNLLFFPLLRKTGKYSTSFWLILHIFRILVFVRYALQISSLVLWFGPCTFFLTCSEDVFACPQMLLWW